MPKENIITLIVGVALICAFFVGAYKFLKDDDKNSQFDQANLNLNFNTNNMDNNSSEQAENVMAVMKTNFGDIKLELYKSAAPKTVNNFLELSQSGFYNGVKFHRVIKNFMIQGGDPNSKDDDWSDDGMGGPGYEFEDEINQYKIVKGVLAMANAGPNTNGSQFFIVTAQSAPWLDGKHTVFGKIIEGMDAVSKIEAMEVNADDHPLEDAIIDKIEILDL